MATFIIFVASLQTAWVRSPRRSLLPSCRLLAAPFGLATKCQVKQYSFPLSAASMQHLCVITSDYRYFISSQLGHPVTSFHRNWYTRWRAQGQSVFLIGPSKLEAAPMGPKRAARIK